MIVRDINKVRKFLERFDFCEVTETFKRLNNTYECELLDIWCENDIAGLFDCGNVIRNQSNSGIKMFLLSSAELHISGNVMRICFHDGEVEVIGLP